MPVKLSDRTSTFGETDIYSTHDSNRGALGFHAVNSLVERNNITLDRRKGTYEAEGANATPKPFFVCVRTGSEVKLYWLSNEPGTPTTTDSDWTEFVAGAEDPFQGFFIPASTTLSNSSGTKGHYWIASAAGSHDFGAGSITFAQYDKAQFDGAIWQKVGGSTAVADWNTMTNKPTEFFPMAHQHTIAQIIGLENQLQNLVPYAQIVDDVSANATSTNLIPSTHSITQFTYSKSEVDTKISNLGTYGISYSWTGNMAQFFQTGMKYGELGLRQDEQKVYRYELLPSGPGWKFFFSVAGSEPKTTELIVSDVAIGGIIVGERIELGTTFTDFVKALLKTTAPAVYYQPTYSAAYSPATTYVEIGSEVTVTIVPTWTVGDSGGVSTFDISRNKDFVFTPIFNNSSPVPHEDTFTLDSIYPVNYMTALKFLAGPVKNDSNGQPSPTGKIQETTLYYETPAITPARKLFYGFDNPDYISGTRSLPNTILNPTDGMVFNINVPQYTQIVTFAYPASLGFVQEVFDGLFDIKEAFTEYNNFEPMIVPVEGANGFAAVDYYVYMFDTHGIPLDAVTYRVTI